MANRNILVVGGAGYIGAHMVCALKEAGYRPIIFDNLSTGHREMVPAEDIFFQGDLKQPEHLREVFEMYSPSAVMHFAAKSLVPESMKRPLDYYENNIAATVNLLKQMVQSKVLRLIFSSTAAVYGNPSEIPLTEKAATEPINPYGHTKLMIEQMIKDTASAHSLAYVVLRYFNAAGAHERKSLHELHDPETHLIPNLFASMNGGTQVFTLYGSDYNTPDGTCVRDFIHVQDLCEAHLLALQYLEDGGANETFNLGCEHGYSVGEVVSRAQGITGKPGRIQQGPRRPGDPPILIASSEKAKKILRWKPERDLNTILRTAWRRHDLQK